jgi:nitrate reductase gamma subunit
MSPPMLIAIHILSVELLMVVFPFTKLTHAVTLFMARYYNGAIAGYKGVKS